VLDAVLVWAPDVLDAVLVSAPEVVDLSVLELALETVEV